MNTSKLAGLAGTTVTLKRVTQDVKVGDVLDDGHGDVVQISYFGPAIAKLDRYSKKDSTLRMERLDSGDGHCGVKERTEYAVREESSTYVEGLTEIIVLRRGHRAHTTTLEPNTIVKIVRPTLLGVQCLNA